jgi:uncharacterized protein (DUF3084 family)
MKADLQSVLTMCALALTLVSMILVNRNARRATSVQSETRDLARMRDLRHELEVAERKLGDVKRRADEADSQVEELTGKLQEANRRGRLAQNEAAQAWTELAELKRMAHRPGMTLPKLLEYIGPLADEPNGNSPVA